MNDEDDDDEDDDEDDDDDDDSFIDSDEKINFKNPKRKAASAKKIHNRDRTY